VRPKKRSALIKPSLLLEATSHTAMGVAVGLAFAFLATHITALGIATLINYSPTLRAQDEQLRLWCHLDCSRHDAECRAGSNRCSFVSSTPEASITD
jgi:hypothetical protein